MEEDRRPRPERYLSDDAQADIWLAMGETLRRRRPRPLRDLQLGALRAGKRGTTSSTGRGRPRSASASRPTSSGRSGGARTSRASRATWDAWPAASGRSPSTRRSCPPKPLARRSSWVSASPAVSRNRHSAARSPRPVTTGCAADYAGLARLGILRNDEQPRPVHRARLPGIERGLEPVRVELSAISRQLSARR